MNELNSLDRLGPITDEMLAGLHADQQMKMRIRAAVNEKRRPAKRPAARTLVPALCCAALAIACVGAVNLRGVQPAPKAAEIQTIAAGDVMPGGDAVVMMMRSNQVADLGDHARVSASSASGESLFASGKGDIPLVTVDGAVYRMLTTPKDVGNSLLGGSLGDVALFAEQPSLASAEDMHRGLSNVAQQGAVIYSIKGLAKTTAVAAEVDGYMRVFQRVSYAGKGPGKQSLEDTFGVRGKVKRLELSGVGVLEGDTANVVIGVLLDNAALKAADASMGKQKLTVTLQSGLKLQLGVSGDTVTGCGGWSCPEFFDAFEAAL